jgi:hypothetical protein
MDGEGNARILSTHPSLVFSIDICSVTSVHLRMKTCSYCDCIEHELLISIQVQRITVVRSQSLQKKNIHPFFGLCSFYFCNTRKCLQKEEETWNREKKKKEKKKGKRTEAEQKKTNKT